MTLPTFIISSLLLASCVRANSGGAPAGYSGAPDDSTCVACHTGTLNSGSGNLTISFPNGAGWTAGQKYRVRVTLQDATATRWGVEFTNRQEATNNFEGAFAVPAGVSTVQIGTRGSQSYVTHTTSGTFQQQVSQAAWEIDWTAPAAGTGTVRFYAAGTAANSDGLVTGDKTYRADLAIPEVISSPPVVAVGNTIFPQFVFGGGWFTAMYFTNTTSSQINFNVNFYSDSATALTVGGQTFKPVQLPPGATATIEAQNTSSLTQGWATFEMPTGVTGYGVFRQSVAGRPDQEASVPFASTSAARVILTTDDTTPVTAVAVWYNGSATGVVNIAANDESGNQIGSTALTMVPGTKRAFTVSDQIPAVVSKRGSLIFSTANGTIAVLGLRFGGAAFTAIPAFPLN